MIFFPLNLVVDGICVLVILLLLYHFKDCDQMNLSSLVSVTVAAPPKPFFVFRIFASMLLLIMLCVALCMS